MSSPPTEARRRLATRLHFAAIHLVRRLRPEAEGGGPSPAQLSVLSTLVREGPQTLTQLAAAEQVRPPTMTRLVQRLEADAYVLREPAPDDGRAVRVRHTSRGWFALEAAAERRAARLAEALDDLDDEALEVLERAVGVLERVAVKVRE